MAFLCKSYRFSELGLAINRQRFIISRMDVFSQGFFLLLLPILLGIVAILAIFGTKLVPIPKENLDDAYNQLIKSIRRFLLLDKKIIKDKDDSKKKK